MNSYQVAILREQNPFGAYQAVVENGDGIYVWHSAGQYSPIASQDYDTIEGLRHGCGNVYASLQAFETAAEAAALSTPIPNAMADAYLRDIGRGRSGNGFRVH